MVANNYTIEDVILLKEELSSNLSKYGSTLLNTIEYGLGGKKKMREYSEKGLLYIELLDKIINKNMSCGHKICTITTTKDGKTTSTRIIGKYGSKYKIKETTTSTITITYKYIDIITSCISPCLYSKIKNYINSLNCNNC